MNSTALGASKLKDGIIFISEAHEKFYYEKLKEVRYQDEYHMALCYWLTVIQESTLTVFTALKQAVLGRNAYRQVGRPVEA